ncbi:MAG: hypothetical protein A2177_14650 [Spirochaetes bacterium RBG_13_68_11]|nr:MAG: hypothetical protein A2177_14650 [Spirochaetes bacterium RBG_13_68_11]
MAAVVHLRTKLFCWLILGTLSVFFAEVAGGSAPFPFYDAWGLYAVLPLYTLHIVFLAFAVMRPARRVPFTALFCAGAVFGLYEAYITKVIWDPTWGEKGLAVGGVYVAQTAMLVLYWHPFMAFLAPLLAGELLLTSSSETLEALPAFLGRAMRTRRVFIAVVAAAVFIGVSKAVNSPTPLAALASILSSAAVPGLLVFLWLRAPGGAQRAGLTLRDLLPDGRQGLVIGVLLAAFTVATGLLIRSEAMPRTIVPHLSVWALYALFCGLAVGVLLRAARRDSAAPYAATPAAALPARGRLMAAAAVFVASLAAVSAALSPFKAAAGALAMAAGLAGMAAGLAITVAAMVAVIRRS